MMLPMTAQETLGNRSERLEWLKDAGLGLFIHWGVDSQIGTVISHSLVGASQDYTRRFFTDLPKTFNPTRFDPHEWARLAKVAGFKYVVFTTKHHSGFCMFGTKTHAFNVMNTPFGRDITSDVVEAFRAEGISCGFYFSPDDFFMLFKQDKLISRDADWAQPKNNPQLMKINQAQVRELFSRYGPIDVFFIDGPPDGLLDLTWQLQPDCVITRGVLNTPEISPSTGEELPADMSDEPWEACFTMGTSWQFKPTNEVYRTGTEWIQALIETRSKGGTMLLNIGPEPNGEIPQEQENILRELGAWMFINGEAIYDVRPWRILKEDNIWYTRKKDENTVYAFVTDEKWAWGQKKNFLLKNLKATEKTVISVLGQNDKILEYQAGVTPETVWEQREDGLSITAFRAQRIYNDREWPNPLVLKITHAR
ncbi:MAG: alpha-L-fucosidase [Candidatus Aminicenantes bacterium]|nr:MAG: alpha-L-fucosidase [Candidatus Aminicenantes bacterium]